MPLVPFGEWLPDLPDYMNTGATVAKNVVPLTDRSYGPFSEIAPITGPLGDVCRGAAAAKSNTGAVDIFAGTYNKLYIMSAGTGNIYGYFEDGYFEGVYFVDTYTPGDGIIWTDVSKAGGYNLTIEDNWNFVQYGDTIIACSITDPSQSYVLGSSSLFADLSADAPQARFIAIVKDFVMVGNTYHTSDGVQPSQVWWSAIDNPASWPTIGTSAAAAVQSDRQILPGDGWIQGLVGTVGGADGAVFLETAIYRIVYEGPPTIFGFYKVEAQFGTRIPGSIVNIGDVAFYLGVDGFYMFDGSKSVPIGFDKIDRTFYDDFNPAYWYNVVGTADTLHHVVMWLYPAKDSIGGIPNKVIIYNWVLQRWSIVESNLENIIRVVSKGYTLDQLDPFGTIDTLQDSLDSRIWMGGSLYLAGFDTEHRMGSFSGTNLPATIETGEVDDGNGGRVFVASVAPIIDAVDPNLSVSLGYRNRVGNPIVYTVPTGVGVDGNCPQRTSARYVRARVSISEAATWEHAQGVIVNAQPDGDR